MSDSDSSSSDDNPARNANYKSPHKNKKPKSKGPEKTYRFELKLNPDRTGKEKNVEYEFNWLDLIAEETEKKKSKFASASTTLDPFASDDEDQLRALAKKFESKYGGAEDIKKKKKARKIDDYADLGYGYDSDDPFIDNSEVHDEIVPENVTTALGGFYVNSGPLEFKARESADEDSDMEAIIQEGEKAAKKRKFRKTNEDLPQPPEHKKKKLFKKVKSADGSYSIVPVEDEPRKQRNVSKPLGRPKMRNPDGSLVHPPRLQKVKRPVLLSGQQTPSSASSSPTSVNAIAAKKVKTAKQVMKVSTPGGITTTKKMSTVININSNTSPKTNTGSSPSTNNSGLSLKKVTDMSPNSTIKDQLVSESQARKMSTSGAVTNSMIKKIPPSSIAPGTTLAGGATISPASASNAASGAPSKVKKSSVNSTPKVSLTTTSSKGMTVKQQLDAARKQQQNGKQNTATQQQQQLPKQEIDIQKVMDMYKTQKQQETCENKPATTSPSGMTKAPVSTTKKPTTSTTASSSQAAPKNKQVAQQSTTSVSAQQYLEMFNRQGIDTISQIQSLMAQANQQNAFKDSQQQISRSNKTNVSPVSNSKAASNQQKLPQSLSVEQLTKSIAASTSNNVTIAKGVTISQSKTQSSNANDYTAQFNKEQQELMKQQRLLIQRQEEEKEKLRLKAEAEKRRQQEAEAKKRLQEAEAKKRREQMLLQQEMERKKEEEAKRQQEEMQRKQMEAKRQELLRQQQLEKQQEAQRKQMEAIRQQQLENQRKLEEEAKRKQLEEAQRQMLEAQRLQQQKQLEAQRKLEAQRIQQQQEAQRKALEAQRKQEAQRKALEAQRKQQLEAQRLQQQKQQQEAERKKMLEQQQKQAMLQAAQQEQEAAHRRLNQQMTPPKVASIATTSTLSNHMFSGMQPVPFNTQTSPVGTQKSPVKSSPIMGSPSQLQGGSAQHQSYSLAYSNTSPQRQQQQQQAILVNSASLNSSPIILQATQANFSPSSVVQSSPQRQQPNLSQTSPSSNMSNYFPQQISSHNLNVLSQSNLQSPKVMQMSVMGGGGNVNNSVGYSTASLMQQPQQQSSSPTTVYAVSSPNIVGGGQRVALPPISTLQNNANNHGYYTVQK